MSGGRGLCAKERPFFAAAGLRQILPEDHKGVARCRRHRKLVRGGGALVDGHRAPPPTHAPRPPQAGVHAHERLSHRLRGARHLRRWVSRGGADRARSRRSAQRAWQVRSFAAETEVEEDYEKSTCEDWRGTLASLTTTCTLAVQPIDGHRTFVAGMDKYIRLNLQQACLCAN